MTHEELDALAERLANSGAEVNLIHRVYPRGLEAFYMGWCITLGAITAASMATLLVLLVLRWWTV